MPLFRYIKNDVLLVELLIPFVEIVDAVGDGGRRLIAEVVLEKRGVGIGADNIAGLHA